MEQFLFYFTHLGIPIIILISILFHRPHTWSGLISGSLFNTFFLWFFYLWGQWPIAAIELFKYLLPAIVFLQLIQMFRIKKTRMKLFPRGIMRIAKNTLLLIGGLLFAYLTILAYQGRRFTEEAVELEFPLKEGNYYIASGGSNAVLNNHYGKGSRSQRYALDINRLGKFGRVTSSIGPGANADHHIFGKAVYAPCDGKIIEMENDVSDNAGGNMDVDPHQGQGNFIVLDCSGTIVSLVHLKKNSVTVQLGQQIQAGDKLGQVGNSGFSQEPHLHLQAARWSTDSLLLGIPMKFNGHIPFRNQIISP